jgi:hypothetical protein
MPNDTGVVDSEHVEQLDHTVSVGTNANGSTRGPIAPTIPEKIDDDDSVSGRYERYDVAPQMARCGESMQEHDGLPRASRAGGVVVQLYAVEVDEFTAHRDAWWRWLAGAAEASMRMGMV